MFHVLCKRHSPFSIGFCGREKMSKLQKLEPPRRYRALRV